MSRPFALAQERLQANKTHAPRRTIVPSVVSGLVSRAHCGYALYRTSTRSSARTLLLSLSGLRRLAPARRTDLSYPSIRQDLLDAVAWTEIINLLEDPSLIQSELDRRLEVARHTDPTKRRETALRRDLTRLQSGIGRLLTAYQEDLLSLDELCHRMLDLRPREYAIRAELQSIADQITDRTAYLRLAETLTAFLARLRSSAKTLDVIERQRVVRLLVKEILIGDDSIVIRHTIPPGPFGRVDASPNGGIANAGPLKSYLLRSGNDQPAPGQHIFLHYVLHLWVHRWRRCTLTLGSRSYGMPMTVCHERTDERRCDAVQEMRVGPSEPAVRSRLQTTASCDGQEPWW